MDLRLWTPEKKALSLLGLLAAGRERQSPSPCQGGSRWPSIRLHLYNFIVSFKRWTQFPQQTGHITPSMSEESFEGWCSKNLFISVKRLKIRTQTCLSNVLIWIYHIFSSVTVSSLLLFWARNRWMLLIKDLLVLRSDKFLPSPSLSSIQTFSFHLLDFHLFTLILFFSLLSWEPRSLICLSILM